MRAILWIPVAHPIQTVLLETRSGQLVVNDTIMQLCGTCPQTFRVHFLAN